MDDRLDDSLLFLRPFRCSSFVSVLPEPMGFCSCAACMGDIEHMMNLEMSVSQTRRVLKESNGFLPKFIIFSGSVGVPTWHYFDPCSLRRDLWIAFEPWWFVEFVSMT